VNTKQSGDQFRLSSLTTRTGDDGTTGLANGQRYSKAHSRFEALGAVDELNSHLGLLRCAVVELMGSESVYCIFLNDLQHLLFELGSELALPERLFIKEEHIQSLEAWTAHFLYFVEPLKEFILPGGHASAAQAHVARTVCRRAERCVIGLHELEPQSLPMRQYLNRLSDTLFAFARFLNQEVLMPDTLWQPQQKASVPPKHK